MRGEMELAEAVRTWVGQVLPGKVAVADHAAVAIDSYMSGTSVPTACLQVRKLVDALACHSAYRTEDEHGVVRLAS
jgi:hypothetical protein